MANIKLELTTLLFEDEVTVWHNYDEYSEDPESTTNLADLFEGYAEDLKGGFCHAEAQNYVLATIDALERGKQLLLDTLREMEDREVHETY
jgi:hypothetical protein